MTGGRERATADVTGDGPGGLPRLKSTPSWRCAMLTTTTPDSLDSFLAVNEGVTLRASVTMTPDRLPR